MHRDDRAQPPCGLGEYHVARAVPGRVVDPGEAVKVEEDDPGPAAAAASLSTSLARSST